MLAGNNWKFVLNMTRLVIKLLNCTTGLSNFIKSIESMESMESIESIESIESTESTDILTSQLTSHLMSHFDETF